MAQGLPNMSLLTAGKCWVACTGRYLLHWMELCFNFSTGFHFNLIFHHCHP